ncbi:MAG: VWA domain-containing protein [Rhodospirillales bacterium]|nr:VWA domain-containing protein [Rhodospirillales bacterium]
MNEGSQRSPAVVSNDGDIDAFLEAVRTAPPATRGRGRLLFALDATMSREGTWDQAAAVQADLFREAGRVGGLSVQLMWFRGVGEFQVCPWTAEPADLVREMTAVRCRAGLTQISRALSHAAVEHERVPVAAMVYAGDACEEPADPLVAQAGVLGMQGLRLFMFQEGHDPVAADVFQAVAKVSGGAYARFGPGSAATLRALLQATAVYAAGGLRALQAHERRTGEKVFRLSAPR